MRKEKWNAKCTSARAENNNKKTTSVITKIQKGTMPPNFSTCYKWLLLGAASQKSHRGKIRHQKHEGLWGQGEEGTKRRGLNSSVHVNYLYCYLLWKSLRTAFPVWSHTLEKGTGETEACTEAAPGQDHLSRLIQDFWQNSKIRSPSYKPWYLSNR